MTPKAIAAKTEAISVLVADDDPLVRAAVNLILSSGYNLLGEATDGAEAIQMARTLRPDILLLDLNMPNKPGMAALRELNGTDHTVRTILLTVAIEKRQI